MTRRVLFARLLSALAAVPVVGKVVAKRTATLADVYLKRFPVAKERWTLHPTLDAFVSDAGRTVTKEYIAATPIGAATLSQYADHAEYTKLFHVTRFSHTP